MVGDIQLANLLYLNRGGPLTLLGSVLTSFIVLNKASRLSMMKKLLEKALVMGMGSSAGFCTVEARLEWGAVE